MSEVKALPNKVLAEMIDKPDLIRKTSGGVYMPDKDNDVSGIRPRWFKVHSIGEGIDWIKVDQYVYVDHGRWSQGLTVNRDLKLHLLDNNDCLLVSDENPLEENL